MGSMIEVNDTLQITKEQGFPPELNLEVHLKKPFKAEDFKDKVFEFHGKDKVRVYHVAPVRNILVENRDGKWIYWGLIHVIEEILDYVNNKTSGKYKIIYIYTPEEMKKMYELIDRDEETRYFK